LAVGGRSLDVKNAKPARLIDAGSSVKTNSLESLDQTLRDCFGTSPGALAPTASVLITRHAETLYERGFGGAGVETIYDLASITKAAVTAPLLMSLVEAGTVQLDQPVAAWLPEWSNTPFATVTMRMLLAHRSGLWEWRPVYLHSSETERSIAFVTSTEARYTPGAGYHYSDLGLMLAGEVVRRASQGSLAQLARDRLFKPLGLETIGFNPPGSLRMQIAPSSRGDSYEERMVATGEPYPIPELGVPFDHWRHHTLLGEVNDCNAYHAFGGEAGHAGLFGSARDLARLADAFAGGQLTSAATMQTFLDEPFDPGQGLVFRIGRLLGRRTFWHAGFTGTRWLCCPDLELVVVLLANRLMRPGEPLPLDDVWASVLAAAAAALRP
jgi:CubicO group peptidase (beta-lactamase class C family)